MPRGRGGASLQASVAILRRYRPGLRPCTLIKKKKCDVAEGDQLPADCDPPQRLLLYEMVLQVLSRGEGLQVGAGGTGRGTGDAEPEGTHYISRAGPRHANPARFRPISHTLAKKTFRRPAGCSRGPRAAFGRRASSGDVSERSGNEATSIRYRTYHETAGPPVCLVCGERSGRCTQRTFEPN